MLELTDAQAALLRRGLEYLISNPDYVLESDFRRVVWVLAQMATQVTSVTGEYDLMQIASDLALEANPPPEYLTLAQAAKLYGVPIATLRWHAKRGSFDAHKSDQRTWLADAHSLAMWASQRSE